MNPIFSSLFRVHGDDDASKNKRTVRANNDDLRQNVSDADFPLGPDQMPSSGSFQIVGAAQEHKKNLRRTFAPPTEGRSEIALGAVAQPKLHPAILGQRPAKFAEAPRGINGRARARSVKADGVGEVKGLDRRSKTLKGSIRNRSRFVAHPQLTWPTTKELSTAIWTARRASAVCPGEKLQAKCQLETLRRLLFSGASAMPFFWEYELVKVVTPASKRDSRKFRSHFR